MKWTNRFLGLLFFLLTAQAGLAQSVEELLNELPNREAFWSITVKTEEGILLESMNSDKLIIPASNLKLYTSAAVLDRLGNDFRYQTNIYMSGSITDSVLYGDLIIRGVGDPSISGIMYDGDREYVFHSFIRQLKEAGINTIAGSLVANIGYFSTQKYPIGWDWYDLSFYYGVEIAPLSFNNNAVDLIVEADGEVGSIPAISWFPYNTDYVELINEQQIIPVEEKYDEEYLKDLGENRIYLGSKLPQGYLEEESLAITNAHLFFMDSFDKYLNRNGIVTAHKFNEQVEDIPDYWTTYPVVASHSSESLSNLLKWANKESDNFYIEMLLRTMSSEITGEPADFKSAIQEVRSFLGEVGIDTTLVLMNDGSGMASGNFTTTGNISEILLKMRSHPEFDYYYESLAIAGIDGSISHRFKVKPLFKNFRGKTGYVSGQRTLSGYLTTKSGQEIIVSIATNNFAGKVRPIDDAHQRILEFLYEKY